MLDLIREMILPYPKSVLLFLVGLVNLCWIIYTIFIQKNFRKKIYKIYFVFALSVFLWTWTNAYAFSALFTAFGGSGLTYTFTLAGLFTSFAMTAFYYLSALIKTGKREIAIYEKIFIGLMIVQNLFFNIVPKMAIEKANVFPDGTFELMQVPFYFLFHVFNMAAIILGFTNVIIGLRRSSREKRQIERAKFIYICLGISIMYGSAILFHMIVPHFFQIYSYAWVPPALSIFDVLIVGYGVVVQRFPDIKFNAARISKKIGAFLISLFVGYVFEQALQTVLGINQLELLYAISLVAFLLSFYWILQFLHSETFHHFFGTTGVELFLQTVRTFLRKNSVYSNFEEFQKDIETTFCEKLQIQSAQILPLQKKIATKYPELVEYCKNHHEILVTKETLFAQQQKQKPYLFTKELQELGEICLPLFHPADTLIGFLVLGKKPFDDLYSKEEIEMIESIEHHLSLELKSVLYSAQLQKEVAEKTRDLQSLIRQQSDFMALSAHEIRTPLNVAIFQLEEMLEEGDFDTSVIEGMETISDALDDLKKLTQRLFEVQQYDLNKIQITPDSVSIRELCQGVFEGFKPLMEEKQFHFSYYDDLKEDVFLSVDASQMKQVLHNLLTNAVKFTPEQGTIVFGIEETAKKVRIYIQDNGKGIPDKEKKRVFQKFQTTNIAMGMGLGLGLHICKKIIELHKGKIWAEDSPDGGATFAIELPK